MKLIEKSQHPPIFLPFGVNVFVRFADIVLGSLLSFKRTRVTFTHTNTFVKEGHNVWYS